MSEAGAPSGRWQKRGFIWRSDSAAPFWDSHTTAPAPLQMDDGRVRIFLGARKNDGPHPVSRVGWIDVDAQNPARVLGVSQTPALDIGRPGEFDDDGVFPAAVLRDDAATIRLYTSGFQHTKKKEIPFLQFGGLALSADGETFRRHSRAPILDRADEGLVNRAGICAWPDGAGGWHCCYSAGGGFRRVDSKMRGEYEIFYQHSADGKTFAPAGKKIVSPLENEHAIGRPYLIFWRGLWLVFFGRRVVGMRYLPGCAFSKDLKQWTRCDAWLNNGLPPGAAGEFDAQMIYYPAPFITQDGRLLLFYCGDNFGETGLGWAEWTE